MAFAWQDLKYDLHFWIGKHSTQDEYGTAAYKSVELDAFVSLVRLKLALFFRSGSLKRKVKVSYSI